MSPTNKELLTTAFSNPLFSLRFWNFTPEGIQFPVLGIYVLLLLTSSMS